MKVRCIDNENAVLELNKIYEVISNVGSYYKIECKPNLICWFNANRFEEVKEVEKTFREVMADMKDGEVWTDDFFKIEMISGSISIGSLNGEPFENIIGFVIHPCRKFKLQRKEYTFEEAFKAYEEGKGIESLIEGQKFKKEGKEDCWFDYDKDKYMSLEWDRDCFTITSVRNKWYIND
ncbi:hypothetical protein ACQPUZ_04660 [Clostridium tertium]